MARVLSWGMLGIAGIRVAIEGERLGGVAPAVIVANHQSAFDLAVFGAVCPRRTIVVGKRELVWIPFFGLLFAAAGNVLIDRRRRERAVAELSQAASVIRRRGASIWMFPEGTRNRFGSGLLPFKKGAFHLAIDAGVPLVPVVASSLKPLVDWKRGRVRPGRVRVRVLPAVPTAGLGPDDADALCEQVRTAMMEAVE